MLKRIIATLAGAAIMLTVGVTAEAAKFKDVQPQHSLYTEIEYLSDRGVINGYSDGTFQPNALMMKKHIAKMLVEALGLETTNMKPLPYKDIPRTHAYYDYIAAAYTAGIFSNADYFQPEAPISRAFMAKIMAKSFNLKSIAENAVTYVDVSKKDDYYSAVQLVTMNDIARGYTLSTGYGPTTYAFAPTNLLTRAHFSAFLARAMSLSTGNYVPDPNYTYFYETINDETLRMEVHDQFTAPDGVWTTWRMYNDESNAFYAENVYHETPGYFTEVVSNAVYNTYMKKPFTIGFKYEQYDEETEEYKTHTILETKQMYNVDGNLYDNVVVVRDTYWSPESNTYTTKMSYIAKFYGIIAVEIDGKRSHWLTTRVPK